MVDGSHNLYDVLYAQPSNKPIFIKLKINKRNINFLFDTGSGLSFIKYDVIKSTPIKISNTNGPIIRLIDGRTQQLLKHCFIQINYYQEQFEQEFFVIQNLSYQGILGLNFFHKIKHSLNYDNDLRRIEIIEDKTKTNIYLKENVKLQANSETLCDIILIDSVVPIVFKQSKRILEFYNLHIEECLLNNNVCALYIQNNNDFPVFLPKGIKLGSGSIFEFPSADEIQYFIQTSIETQLEDNDVSTINIDDTNLDEKNQIKALLEKYKSNFAFHPNQLGHAKGYKHHIETECAEPIKLKSYRLGYAEREESERQVAELLKAGLIKRSTSSWSTPIIMVKQNNKFRMVYDFRKLNSVTKEQVYPIPRVEEILDSMEGKPYRSSMDFRSGYHQIELTEESKPKTAFVAGGASYEWNVLPFGLKNAPMAFQSYVNQMLDGLINKTCSIYIDDLLAYSSTFEDHLKDLETIMKRIESHNMKLNPTKCHFLCKQFKFLGFIINNDGMLPDPAKTKAISEMKVPKTIKEIRRFLGMCCYYRKHIFKYSEIVRPITNLLKKESKLQWSNDCQKAFDEMKKRLTEAPILAHYSRGKPLILSTDASNFAVAAILSQEVDGKEKVLQYASGLMDKHQINYTISEKEMLAIVWSCVKFRHYLLGQRFKIITDHCSLCYLMKLRNPSGRLCRWALKLMEFEFDIVYKSGKLHNNVDTLSRAPTDEIVDKSVEDIPMCQVENIDMIEEQNKDKYCQFVKQMLNKNMPRFTKKFTEYQGIIYRKTFNSIGEEIFLVVLPKSLRKEVLFAMHNDQISGHQGVTRTLYRIRTRFYWPRSEKTVRKYVESCKECQHTKRKTNKHEGLLQPIITLSPFQIVALDLMGPYPPSKNKTFVIVIIDLYTRYLELGALPNSKSETIARFFMERTVLRHGSPAKILTDNAQYFNSNFLEELVNILTLKHLRTTNYRPQTNGSAERVCKSVTDMIKCYISTDQRDWSKFINFLAYSHNTARNDSTGQTPYFMLYNRNPRTPLDVAMNLDVQFIENKRDLEHIYDAKNLIKLSILDAKYSQKATYDMRRKAHEFKVGEKVLVFTPFKQMGQSRKLEKNYLGPKIITRRLGPVNYLVEDLITSKVDNVHVDRMKRYFDEDIDLEEDKIWITTKELEQLGYPHEYQVKFERKTNRQETSNEKSDEYGDQ